MASYVIGDVQGCFKQLQSLLAKINFDPKADELWFCGDLVARGPDSLATLRFIHALGTKAKIVLGNHDLHFLACVYGFAKVDPKDQLDELLKAPDLSELVNWLQQQPLMHFDAERNVLLVHAGLAPDWDLSVALTTTAEVSQLLKDSPEKLFAVMYGNTPSLWSDAKTDEDRWRFAINSCTRMRFCLSNGALELKEKRHPEKVTTLRPWYEFWERKSHPMIFFGHWAALMGHSPVDGIYALDTGCVWGNYLTAYCIETTQRYSVCD
ncbi:symmetrical bis(5'-nucleosyl)-tetraphosphatase [Rheinheimera sediminis]|uniref:symmetrical bis(5'-nucleosyl)-tetraphosphatase n=1 Tax=Rheinheimera sp. YQF-1 TaxID=2499626 RepID=UPI000FD81904|nr:symmetrical bis(5'-nucleosyl)-tetraphosphatase [Rheinheimera sp. YQF-1]RVT45713.1 symmetrical bis(5'-nucleosyl)-tetraphosphatase [Rheinheimera sp. YQF-1]